MTPTRVAAVDACAVKFSMTVWSLGDQDGHVVRIDERTQVDSDEWQCPHGDLYAFQRRATSRD